MLICASLGIGSAVSSANNASRRATGKSLLQRADEGEFRWGAVGLILGLFLIIGLRWVCETLFGFDMLWWFDCIMRGY